MDRSLIQQSQGSACGLLSHRHLHVSWSPDTPAASGRKQHFGHYFPDLNIISLIWWTKHTSACSTCDSQALGIAAAPPSPFQCSVPLFSCCNGKFAPHSPTCCRKRNSGKPNSSNSMSVPGIFIHLIMEEHVGSRAQHYLNVQCSVIPALKTNGHNQPKQPNVS